MKVKAGKRKAKTICQRATCFYLLWQTRARPNHSGKIGDCSLAEWSRIVFLKATKTSVCGGNDYECLPFR